MTKKKTTAATTCGADHPDLPGVLQCWLATGHEGEHEGRRVEASGEGRTTWSDQ